MTQNNKYNGGESERRKFQGGKTVSADKNSRWKKYNRQKNRFYGCKY